MLYTFRCQKGNCRQTFDASMAIEVYERKKEQGFNDIRCTYCGTKSPVRHYDARSTPSVHRDFGTFDPRTAPAQLAGQHYQSKDEKEQMVEATLGSNYGIAEVDSDKTAAPKRKTRHHVRAADAKPSDKKVPRAEFVRTAYMQLGAPMSAKDMAKKLKLPYGSVYKICRSDKRIRTVSPGVFEFAAV